MNDGTDPQLLRTYAESRSEAAFAELVRRHVDFVYSAALRMVCDSHLAEDVTQGVFVAFAKNAPQLTNRLVLSGWLHRTTQNIAAQTVRTIERRRAREQEAVAMNELLSTEPDTVWEHIAPQLDEALGELNEGDRDALLLRYFERKSAREMAQTLDTSEDAAQKRVSRAVERLREFFAKRGITVGASGLAVVITANAVQAAPAGLAATIATAAALAGTAIATTATVTAIKTIAMTTLQKTLVTATVAVLAGTGIYEAHQVQALRQQQAPLTEQIQQLQTLRAELEQLKTTGNATQNEEITRLRKDNLELPKLRNEVRNLRDDKKQLTQQAQAAQIQAQRAQAQAIELAASEKQRLANLSRQTEYEARIKAIVDANGGPTTPLGQAATVCLNNLRQIDGAKQQWALENNKDVNAIPTEKEIATYVKDGLISKCPAGGSYTLSSVGAVPTCTIPGHALPH